MDEIPGAQGVGREASGPFPSRPEHAADGEGNSESSEPNAPPEYTRVEVERMEDAPHTVGESMRIMQLPKPPIIAAWLCLAFAWFFLGSSTPMTVFIGLPVNIFALLLALVCVGRGGILTGFCVGVLGTVGSLLVYMIGVFRFLGNFLA